MGYFSAFLSLIPDITAICNIIIASYLIFQFYISLLIIKI